jgi:hypothetical protein
MRCRRTLTTSVINNALLESFLVHVRSLKAFLYDPKGREDDVCADDYVVNAEEWRRARGEVPDLLKKAAQRTGGEVAHLSTRRRLEPDAKQWDVRELVQALVQPFCQFVAMTPAGRLDWRIHHLAADLGSEGQRRGAE